VAKEDYTLGIIDPSDFSKKEVSGGSSGFLTNILPYLNAERVIIFGIGLNETIPWKAHYLESNVKFVPICNLRSPSKIPMRLKVLIYYIRHQKRILNSGVDILYVQMPECCLPFLNNSKAIPVIYHKHGSANPVARSKYFYGRNIVFQKFFEYALRLIYKKAHWIIAIDRLCFQESIRNGGENKTSLLMNAVDMQKFAPHSALRKHARMRFGLTENDYAILFVGRIEKPKGPKQLLDCIPFLKEERRSFRIFYAGEGTYKTYLESFVVNNHYEASVTFLGHVKHEDLPFYYNMSDVLVLPSEMEGVPMVILESLACGTPVVASNVGGIPDLVIDGINGTVIDDLGPRQMTSAINGILHANLDRGDICKTAERFGSSNFVAALDDIIKDVLIRV
jgi:glycosyltransferase involved in cell wall biosynthesis